MSAGAPSGKTPNRYVFSEKEILQFKAEDAKGMHATFEEHCKAFHVKDKRSKRKAAMKGRKTKSSSELPSELELRGGFEDKLSKDQDLAKDSKRKRRMKSEVPALAASLAVEVATEEVVCLKDLVEADQQKVLTGKPSAESKEQKLCSTEVKLAESSTTKVPAKSRGLMFNFMGAILGK